jgi:hypothetical protein
MLANMSAIREYARSARSSPARNVWGAAARATRSAYLRRAYSKSLRFFQKNLRLLDLNDVESRFLTSLQTHGYAIAPSFFSKELVDRIYFKSDAGFRSLTDSARNSSCPELTHPSAARNLGSAVSPQRECEIELADPLVLIPEALDVVFHESILKIVTHCFHHIPRRYKVAVVRDFPHHRPKPLAHSSRDEDSLQPLHIFIDLVDTDATRGPLLFIPECGREAPPHSDSTVRSVASAGAPNSDPAPSRNKWTLLRPERGSVVAIFGKAEHRGSLWTYPADVDNKPRTSIRISVSGYLPGDLPEQNQNRMLKWNFERMTGLQQMLAYPSFAG